MKCTTEQVPFNLERMKLAVTAKDHAKPTRQTDVEFFEWMASHRSKAMKFNRDIFLDTPDWVNWATLDQSGSIFVYEHQPHPSRCQLFWQPETLDGRYYKVGDVGTIGLNLMPRRIRKP